MAEEGWQKAIGLANFTRGQKALPGLIIDRATHRDTKLTVAYFSAVNEQDKKALDVRFNFRPTLARSGNHLILSSTDQLAKDMIDVLSNEAARPARPLPGVHTLVEFNSARLATTLGVNRENLIRQNMLGQGGTREGAETQVNVILTVLEYLGQARLIVAQEAKRSGQPYVSERWPGGLLTNYSTVRKRLHRLIELERLSETGEISIYSKKMISTLRRERRKIDRNLGGVRTMDQMPGALVVVDPGREYIAVGEAKKLGIPTVCLTDTDSSPDNVDVVVPGNDDSIGAIAMFISFMADAVLEGISARDVRMGKTVQPVSSEPPPTAVGAGSQQAPSPAAPSDAAAKDESAPEQ